MREEVRRIRFLDQVNYEYTALLFVNFEFWVCGGKDEQRRIHPDHLQEVFLSCWSFAIDWSIQMIICKRPVPWDDHLQEAGPFRWSFAGGLSLWMIICKRPALPDHHKQEAGLLGWSFSFLVIIVAPESGEPGESDESGKSDEYESGLKKEKKINGDTDQPTDWQGEHRAIFLFQS